MTGPWVVGHVARSILIASALVLPVIAMLGILAAVSEADQLATPSVPSATGGPGVTVGPTASTGPTSSPAQSASPAPTPTEIPLTFAEECDGPELNPLWSPVYGPEDAGHGLDSDFRGGFRRISVSDGLCTLTAERARTRSGRTYAAAAMGTRNTFAQAFGTFEARLRYPAGQGVWPAFWLLPEGMLRPPPEIDILEAYPGHGGPGGGSGANVVVSALHYAGGTHFFSHDAGLDMTTDFHTYRLVWSPGLLVFSIDGVETGRMTRDVPEVAMYPILNLALGAPGFRVDATTPDQMTMDIDYVRIWAP
jgi:hypothetical protein